MKPIGTNSDYQYNEYTREWECPKCGYSEAEDVNYCRYCDRQVDAAYCPDCEEKSDIYPQCDHCGHIDKTAGGWPV